MRSTEALHFAAEHRCMMVAYSITTVRDDFRESADIVSTGILVTMQVHKQPPVECNGVRKDVSRRKGGICLHQHNHKFQASVV